MVISMPINKNENENNSYINTIIINKKKKKSNIIKITDNSFSIKNDENNKYLIEFEFNLYILLLFDKNGQIIFNSSNIDSDSNSNIIPIEIYSKIIKNIIKINENQKNKNKSKNKTLHYYIIKNESINIDILNIEKTNIYLLGSFNRETHSSIRKIFLLYILLSFLNYMGEKSSFIIKEYDSNIDNNTGNKSCDMEKINVYSNKDSINIISSNNNYNYLEGNDNNDDLLYSKIYEYFLLLPLIKFFILISKNLFIRHNYYSKGSLYKNFYLVDLDSDNSASNETGQILFSMENLYNLNNGIHPVRNIKLNQLIWKEILFHGKFMKKNYEKKFGKILDFVDYQQFYITLEFKATHPRLLFVIRFLPLLNGILLIHEYEMKSYAFEDNYEEDCKEMDIVIGNSLTTEEDEEEEENEGEEDEFLLTKEPKFIKEREYFFINYILSTNSNINNNFYIKNSPIKYFSNDILNIINKTINKYSESLNIENIILNINNELYNEYLQLNNIREKNPILICTKKIIYKNIKNNKINNNIISLESINEDSDKIINKYQWNYTKSPFIKNLFQIEQKYILIILFNYRKDLKNNQLTIDLSKLDNYPNIENNNNIINNDNDNDSKINIKEEKLSQLLNNDEISDFSESIYLNNLNNEKMYYKDKKSKNLNKKVKNNKISYEENKISDEDKSKDKMNIIYDNDKSSIFNLDITHISKNDIGLQDTSKLDKDKSINNKDNNNSIRKMSDEEKTKYIYKVNSMNVKNNHINILSKRSRNDNEKIEEKNNTNISLLPKQNFEKINDEIDKKNLNKKFLNLYHDTISSDEKYSEYQNQNKNNNKEKNE